MTDLRSSVSFRSNIYPTSTTGALYNDQKFLNAISDPEALDILWRHGGSHGMKLNSLQRKQHDKAIHCSLADEGDYPWGTPVGSDQVVCLCEKVDCPRYRIECSKFHPPGFVPSRKAEAPTVITEAERGRATEKRSTVTRPTQARSTGAATTANQGPKSKAAPPKEKTSTPTRRSSFSFVSASTVERRAREASKATMPTKSQPKRSSTSRGVESQTAPWTKREDAILREMYPNYGISLRKWTKPLPGRSVAEVLNRARALDVHYVPRREREANRNGSKPRVAKSPKAQEKAAKKRHREAMRRRPWEPKEDEIIRRNYPRFGAEMKDWPQKLYCRTKVAIEARARQLGL